MSLVWCLYGRQMDKVDDLYRKEIEEKGGYSKYIGNSLNIQAKKKEKPVSPFLLHLQMSKFRMSLVRI